MKRRRAGMEKGSEIRSAIEELSMAVKVKPGDDHDAALIPTKPFLLACNLVLQVLDKIGPTMAVLRQDIHQNIQRLEKLYESDPSVYSNLVEMLKKEVSEGNARKFTSCSRALVWLTRSIDFTVALLERLVKDPGQSMEQVIEESYNLTLKPWHGWISSAAYKVNHPPNHNPMMYYRMKDLWKVGAPEVALKLVPESKTFICLLMAEDEDYDTLKEEMQCLISLLMPLQDEIHSTLRTFHLAKLKAT
ncbi:hypothetical protein HHK36_009275 [Tetracentron sinense]|uniref:Glycolipid transfer protein domain-containing protein n=1 Tax=Tetracentron sinense TaxID=13715 RepID=A0A834ZL14_TETSI|nr:hypothetical protein HHK36_009275 [Tetracentron sinense]